MLTATPVRFDAGHFARLRDVGLDDLAIVDLVNSGAFFSWSNRLMLSLGEPTDAGRRRARRRAQPD